MMGRTTLREVREALAAARAADGNAPTPTTTVGELEAVVRLLEMQAGANPTVPVADPQPAPLPPARAAEPGR